MDKRRLPLASDAGSHRTLRPARAVDAVRPIYAVWEVTLQCDLACGHCGSRAGLPRPDELSTSEALDLILQMKALGVREVSLIGGEAYLRSDWLTIIRAIRDAGMIANLTTGGRGLDEARARGAADAGLQAASVSIDGLRDVHDHLRRLSGSFDAAINAVRVLSRASVRTTVNTQINRRSLRDLEGVYDLLEAEKARAWQVQLTVPAGRALDGDELLLEPYQLVELMPLLARLKRRADVARIGFWPGNNIGYFGPHEADLRAAHPAGYACSCGAGRTTLGIESNGDIKGCPSLPTSDYVGGNVRKRSLLEVWEGADALRFTRDRPVTEAWGFCATCYYSEHCIGGCSWTAHSISGRRGNNPLCHHRALELLSRGTRERLVRSKAAPGIPFDYGRYEIVEEPWPEVARERARAIVTGTEERLLDENTEPVRPLTSVLSGTVAVPNRTAALSYELVAPLQGRRATALLLPGLGGSGARGYEGLVNALIADGVAVVSATVEADVISLEEEVTGLLGMLDSLEARGLVDARTLAIVAHSRGATLAPVIAASRAFAKIVVFGATSRRFADALTVAARLQSRARGLIEADAEKEVALAQRLYTALLREGHNAPPPELGVGIAHRDVGAGALFGQPLRGLRELDAVEPIGAWAKVSAPVLVLRGERDDVVAHEDVARIVAACAGPASEELVPGADHALRDEQGNVAADAIERILRFLGR